MSLPNFSDDEKRRLFMTLDANTKELAEQTAHLKQVTSDVATIKLGMFGNDALKIPGLVKDNEECKDWRRGFKLKMAFFAGGITSLWEAGKLLVEHIANNTKQ